MKRLILRGLFSLCFSALPVLSSVNAAEHKDLITLITWLEGAYSNQVQVDAGVLDTESNLLFPIFKQVDIPAFGEQVIYLQWHVGSPEGRLQRQRIWSFSADEETGAISMDFYTLKDPAQWLDAHLDSAKVKNMTHDDVIGYPDECLLPVVREGGRYVARIPTTCAIISQSTKTSMTLQSETTIGPKQITYQEAGVRENGALVFQVPPQGRYVFSQLLK